MGSAADADARGARAARWSSSVVPSCESGESLLPLQVPPRLTSSCTRARAQVHVHTLSCSPLCGVTD